MKISISFFLALFGLQNCKAQKDKTLPADLNEYSILDTNFKSENLEVILLTKEARYSGPIRLFYSVNK